MRLGRDVADVTILVVESNAIVLSDIAMLLRDLGYSRVICDTAAASAASRAGEQPIGLALLDLDRLHETPAALARRFAEDNTALVLMSSESPAPDLRPPFDAGAILFKPFSMASLEQAIATAIKRPGQETRAQ